MPRKFPKNGTFEYFIHKTHNVTIYTQSNIDL